ncbi:Laccase-1 [Drechslerella dactyloides]|uniref:Laccase-1 n=1 Tax=Drechslerella dactyloides TaxID=74499 RepID=A0AAD6J365_DREDA|nr:Laccase-1 [Drechslerella dactyloides]
MRPLAVSFSVLSLIFSVVAKTVTYDFNVTYTDANPDGQFSRRVIGINGKWPIPTIDIEKGDRVVVNLVNGLPDVETSLHFHGIFQNGTAYMDGPAGVTQCPLGPGQKMTYNFTVNQPGTYWYHSHVKGQYPDGIRAPFIVRDPKGPYAGKYDEEVVIALSDWYHDENPILFSRFLSVGNPTGAEPVPNSALMNETQGMPFNVLPGKTYMVRMVNMAAFAAQYFWIEGHTMRIVEVDGEYTEEAEADMIYLTAAQRYSFLLTTKNDTSQNFAIVGSMDQDLFDAVPDGLNPNVTGHLIYDSSKPLPDPEDVDAFEPFDDFTLVPLDGEYLWEDPTYSFSLEVLMDNLGDGANYAFFNGITYTPPKVPTLYSALNAGNLSMTPEIYGRDTNPHVFKHHDVVELVVNNNDPGKHPFHLHGHTFQLAYRSDDDAGLYNASDPSVTFSKKPMRRDTVLINPGGNMVLRFRADNPGVWLFHCHIEWHIQSGLVATFIEAPDVMQQTQKLPADHLEVCTGQNLPITGNAAAKTDNYLDLTGQNLSVPPLPAGFTARGIVALVFSIVAAFLGLAAIAVYGSQELKHKTA